MNKKLSNKGFTLVELIIVVAIIAVLAGVLAPQYLRYVERARESNDLQVATMIARAATVAIADPTSDISANQYIEILWITGEESGAEVTRGSIMVRHNDGFRESAFTGVVQPSRGPDGSYTDSSNLEAFAENIFMVLSSEGGRIADRPGWLQLDFQDAESKMANESNFAIHIHTTTGEVALAGAPDFDVDHNRWIDIGLDVTPFPETP